MISLNNVNIVEAELTKDNKYDETVVLQALAEMKQVKDVLLNRLGESDCVWEGQQK